VARHARGGHVVFGRLDHVPFFGAETRSQLSAPSHRVTTAPSSPTSVGAGNFLPPASRPRGKCLCSVATAAAAATARVMAVVAGVSFDEGAAAV